EPLWRSSARREPELWVCADQRYHTMRLAAAGQVTGEPFRDGGYTGRCIRLSDYADVDVCVELCVGIGAGTDELLIQVDQAGGNDIVYAVRDLYCIEKATAEGGYMLLPQGSGYLIAADCPDALPGVRAPDGFIGARWSLPMFGMVRGDQGLCAIVETWWDCNVSFEHVPEERSGFSFDWEPSLGRLDYARRMIVRFGQGMGYVEMAKLYRQRARAEGLVRTLEEKAEVTPAIRKYAENILYRLTEWDPQAQAVGLENMRRFREEGLGVTFFFPKTPNGGYTADGERATEGAAFWQAYLHPNPVPGGWPKVAELVEKVHELGGLVQGFICPITQDPEGLDYDEERHAVNAMGVRGTYPIGLYDGLDRTKRVLDALETNGVRFDVFYWDGFAANADLPQDFSAAHPMTRRANFEMEVACLAETRRRGIMPGAEVGRHWFIGECDYFFFTDWHTERLANTPDRHVADHVGEPIPLFQLVFHDCMMAGFSGGGYIYLDDCDWWAHRTPRLYELLFASAPAYNWLPKHVVPITDWDDAGEQRKRDWLKQWSAFHRAIAMSEMVSHEFLSADRKRQRTTFANGVTAEFNLGKNQFRVSGVAGFDGDWQTPPAL
ncbi:MAG: hypothetical protein CMJ49_09130, partial [Planctomycetaceae bacterium]|nr:hypothetical protein [Planctomycetaceae bacterium]